MSGANKQTLLSRVTKALNEADSVILDPEGKPYPKSKPGPGRSVNPELLKRFQDRKTSGRKRPPPKESQPAARPGTKFRTDLYQMYKKRREQTPAERRDPARAGAPPPRGQVSMGGKPGRRPLTGLKDVEAHYIPRKGYKRWLGRAKDLHDRYRKLERRRQEAVRAQAEKRHTDPETGKIDMVAVRSYMAGRAISRHQRRQSALNRLFSDNSSAKSTLNIRGF